MGSTASLILSVMCVMCTLICFWQVARMRSQLDAHLKSLATCMAALKIHLEHHHEKFGECEPRIDSFTRETGV